MTTQTKKRRRIMREFKISEISAVDRPAQGHARMTLMKSNDFQKIIRTEPVSFSSFEQACAHLRKLHGLSGCGAMERARREFPAAYQKYQRDGEEQLTKAAAAAAPRAVAKAVRDFEKRVDEVRAAEKCSGQEAMERARKKYPEEFEAYRRV